MSKPYSRIAIAAVVAAATTIPVHAASFGIAKTAPSLDAAASTQLVRLSRNLSGKERLRRLMRPHLRVNNPITRSVRAATGNPNITVIDRRPFGGARQSTGQCSFITLRGERALICD